jgi:hypothetical protein
LTKGKYSEQKAKEAQQKPNAQQIALRSHCNRCGANDHQTNQCPHHPFVKREEVHLMQQGCCSDSTNSSDFDYESEKEILLHQKCHCDNPNFCYCESSSESESESDDNAQIREKLKVCMYNSIGDQDAQMLAQIKALPEGDMKSSLFETFLKTMKTGQGLKDPEIPSREENKPLFLEASFERNTKSFIKHNKEEKVQHTSITDLSKEITFLKKEVAELKSKLRKFEEESEDSYKVDSWARQEIRMIKEQLESLPPEEGLM